MFSYILKRLLFLIPTLLGITLIAFLLLKNIPGDPVYTMVGQRASEEIVEQYRAKLGLDQPWWQQYYSYLGQIFKGNMGYSYYTGEPVAKVFWQKFPNTLRLALAAMLIAILGGVCLGILAAVKHNTILDRLLMLGATCGISLPVFWWGLVLIIIFAYILRWLPPSGMGNGRLVYLILPAVTLGSRSLAYIARVTRASMLEVFNQPYITSVKSRGVNKWSLIAKHSLRNALIPVITLIALDLGSYLNGAVLTETIFSWDGIGRWAVVAIFKRDYPIILAVVLWGALIFVSVNLIADIGYRIINPKIRGE